MQFTAVLRTICCGLGCRLVRSLAPLSAYDRVLTLGIKDIDRTLINAQVDVHCDVSVTCVILHCDVSVTCVILVLTQVR